MVKAAKSKNVVRNPIAWSMWANVLGVYAGTILMVCGVLAVCDDFPRGRSLGAASLGIGVFVLLFEWPRGKRAKGATIPREFQHVVQPFVEAFGPLGRNLFFRAVVWLMASVAAYFTLPTILGGVTLTFSALVYFLAAFLGESWAPLEKPRKAKHGPQVSEAPSKPPPRLIAAPTSAPPRNPEVSKGYADPPAVAAATAPRGRTATEAPNRPVPVPSEAPNRPVPVPNRAQTMAVGEAPSRPVPMPVTRTVTVSAGPSRPPPKPVEDGDGGADEAPVSPQPKPRPKPQPKHDKFRNYPWEAAVDPESGSTYYINNATQETQWEKPDGWDEYVQLYGGDSSNA